MFNIAELKENLKDLVGFREQEVHSLDDSLTTSTSSIYINDAHPLLSLDVLDSVRPENLTLDEFLEQTRANSIAKTIADVITIKNLAKATKEVLAETQIFDSTASLRNLEAKNSRFVSWIIRPNKANYLNHIIKKAGLQFLEADTIKLYVYHSSNLVTPVRIENLAYTTPTAVQWVDLSAPLVLNYKDIDSGGYYLLGYYEDDLLPTNQAIYKEHYLDRRPCGGCNPYNFGWYSSWSKYFKINTGVVEELNTLDVKNIKFINDRNYGLNFKITSKCDITDFLIENSNMLVYPILYRVSIDLLRYVEMSPTRNNAVSDLMSKESYIAINGQVSENNFIKVKGIIHEYDDKIKSLDFNLSRISPVCLPCSDKGIRWR